MSKAYDRVEWSFLENIMKKMGFADKWVDRVMRCVCSVSYVVKVNDHLSGEFRLERGLRQGDPLSPYLFLLCREVLSAKVSSGLLKGDLSGVKINDSIFFIKATANEPQNLKRILTFYEDISGQRINFDKSEISFSENTPADIRSEIIRILDVVQVPCYSRYLGFSLVMGQRKTEVFRCIVEKAWKKINDWKYKMLSAAGREVLIKAVIQSLPVYMMSVYRFPEKCLQEVTKLISQFWWDKKDKNKGTSWIKHEILQKKKKLDGSLGFRDVRGSAVDCKIWRGVMKIIELFKSATWWDDGRELLRWKLTSNGQFSVKSAYEMIKDLENRRKTEEGEQSDSSGLKDFWKRIWSSKVPNKVKILCWRMYYNSLPDARNLWRRGLILDYRCKFCGYGMESISHLVKYCWWPKELFLRMGLYLPIFEGVDRAVIVGKSLLNLIDTHYWPNPKENIVLTGCWQPTGQDALKINVDGSWDVANKRAGVGVVARNHEGVIEWVYASWRNQCNCSLVKQKDCLFYRGSAWHQK
ncbi:hypothetical protein QQ045_015616 [Rhodiola kirilowii]